MPLNVGSRPATILSAPRSAKAAWGRCIGPERPSSDRDIALRVVPKGRIFLLDQDSGEWGRAAELTDVFYSQAGLYSSDPRACLSAPALSKADPRPRGAPAQNYAGIERDRDTGICHTLAGVVVGRMEAIESFISALASS